MLKINILFFYLLIFFLLIHFSLSGDNPNQASQGLYREIIIEDFDDGEVELYSYPEEDEDPDDWSLDTEITFEDSPYSLKLFGNTWKVETIEPVIVDTGDVWQVAVYVSNLGEIQGFGVTDGENELRYSLYGSQMLDIEEWVPVYQGAFEDDEWAIFQLPVADDWFAWYEYYPVITDLIFINDNDTGSGVVYFDKICNITEDLPVPPTVEITYVIGEVYRSSSGLRSVDVQFYAEIIDPDSEEFSFLWNFGDDSTSVEQDPFHSFIVEDDHPYTILLEVEDESGCWGQGTCQIDIDPGETTFPITMNFVGDIMLARGYEQAGGIIQTQGVEAIFEPTLSILGDAADITVANLECPLTTYNIHHPTKTIYFKGHPDNVAGLVYGGIDIVTLANNHILDYNYPGLLETQEVLTESGILHSGAGIDSYEAYLPIFYNQSGVNIAFLASSDRTGQYNNYQPYLNASFNKPGFAYMTPYYISQQIDEVRDNADLVVLEMHAGSEYSTGPGSGYDFYDPAHPYVDEEYNPLADIPHMWDIAIRHHAVDSGADLVIVHHPHIIQGLELYNGKLIVHSLGNYIFDLSYAETMPTMILNTKINETGFYEFSITPVYIDDLIPVEATGEFGLHILDYISRRSKEMGTYLSVDPDNNTASVIMDTLNMEIFENHNDEFIPINFDGEISISDPLHLPRNGSISSIDLIIPSSDWEYRLGREIIWFGNFEDEGCTLWNVNSDDEWYDDTEAYEGVYSLRHRRFPYSGDNIVTNLERRIKNYEAANHSLHGYIKTQNGSDVTIEIRYYSTRWAANPVGSEDIGVHITGDTDWTYFHKELDVPYNGNYFDIRASSDCPADGEAFSWFDNIGIIQWEEWQDFDYSENFINPNDYYYLQIRTNSFTQNAIISYTETNYNHGPQVEVDDVVSFPKNFKLYNNFPNPFNPETKIQFSLPYETDAKLKIYNIKGQLVKTLKEDRLDAGNHTVIWNGTDQNEKKVSSGIYFYQLKADKFTKTRKCLLLK